VHFQKMSKWLD